jgi:hypothetical protein
MPHVVMSLAEMVEGGYLQEANRRFFHPLGLALRVTVDETKQPVSLDVIDYRDDAEGVFFGPAPDAMEASRRLAFAGKIDAEFDAKRAKRTEILGDVVQGEAALAQVIAKG